MKALRTASHSGVRAAAATVVLHTERAKTLPVVEGLERRRLLSAIPSLALSEAHHEDQTRDVATYLPPQHALAAMERFLSPAKPGKPLAVAKQFLREHAEDLGLRPADLSKVAVTDQYADADSGVTHIYLRQKVNGLQVVNANLSIHLSRDNRVIMAGGGFVGGAASASAAGAELPAQKPGRTAATALRDAVKHYGLAVDADVKVVKARRVNDIERKQWLRAPGASVDDIPARLHYVAHADGLVLAWDVVLRTPDDRHWFNASVDATTGEVILSADWVSHATYNVLAMPTEAPHDGPRTLATDPHDATVSPFGWHDTNGIAGSEFTTTNGNNVHAYLDRDDNDVPDPGGSPDGGSSLTFDYPLDLTQPPTAAGNQHAATTNLFYWNNLLHDVHARYGFTEGAGNFQARNYSNQGIGNDAVNAEAQDGGGLNNAYFATPPDGNRPRMQMYLFNKTTPGRDGDLENHLIIHEYGHGVSTRLTGGAANSNSLTADQSKGMGEGWSDWWALMLTMKPTDVPQGRHPFATYVNGHDRVTGAGFRRFPYSYDLAIDPLTFAYYNNDSNQQVHRTGEIWCSALWDMTWLLVSKHGYSSDISHGHDAAFVGRDGGNNLALKLVMDGLKLQPANPSFIQARNAILAADTALTGGANHAEIWQAFARRGLGYSASTTSSTSPTVTLAFDLPPVVVEAPAAPDLLAESDSGVSETDNLTRNNNSGSAASLKFSIAGVTSGATVTLLADGVAVGSAIASGSSTIVTTDGASVLADGARTFMARQTLADGSTSPASKGLQVTIDTMAPRISQWQSAAVHARGVGEVGLTIAADGMFAEPRLGGVQTLLLSLSELSDTSGLAIKLWGTGSDNLPLDLTGIGWTAPYRTTGASPVLAIVFSSGLPDYARYLVRAGGLTDLAGNAQVANGDAQRVFTALLGDASGDGRVDNTDLGGLFTLRGINPISPLQLYEVRCDLTLDGRIDNTDAGGLMSVRGKDARRLSTPVTD